MIFRTIYFLSRKPSLCSHAAAVSLSGKSQVPGQINFPCAQGQMVFSTDCVMNVEMMQPFFMCKEKGPVHVPGAVVMANVEGQPKERALEEQLQGFLEEGFVRIPSILQADGNRPFCGFLTPGNGLCQPPQEMFPVHLIEIRLFPRQGKVYAF